MEQFSKHLDHFGQPSLGSQFYLSVAWPKKTPKACSGESESSESGIAGHSTSSL